MATQTAYVYDYFGVRVTIEIDDRAFADFNNAAAIHKAVDEVFKDQTKKVLSDNARYRVYMKQHELGKLFTGIEKVYELTK